MSGQVRSDPAASIKLASPMVGGSVDFSVPISRGNRQGNILHRGCPRPLLSIAWTLDSREPLPPYSPFTSKYCRTFLRSNIGPFRLGTPRIARVRAGAWSRRFRSAAGGNKDVSPAVERSERGPAGPNNDLEWSVGELVTQASTMMHGDCSRSSRGQAHAARDSSGPSGSSHELSRRNSSHSPE